MGVVTSLQIWTSDLIFGSWAHQLLHPFLHTHCVSNKQITLYSRYIGMNRPHLILCWQCSVTLQHGAAIQNVNIGAFAKKQLGLHSRLQSFKPFACPK